MGVHGCITENFHSHPLNIVRFVGCRLLRLGIFTFLACPAGLVCHHLPVHRTQVFPPGITWLDLPTRPQTLCSVRLGIFLLKKMCVEQAGEKIDPVSPTFRLLSHHCCIKSICLKMPAIHVHPPPSDHPARRATRRQETPRAVPKAKPETPAATFRELMKAKAREAYQKRRDRSWSCSWGLSKMVRHLSGS